MRKASVLVGFAMMLTAAGAATAGDLTVGSGATAAVISASEGGAVSGSGAAATMTTGAGCGATTATAGGKLSKP